MRTLLVRIEGEVEPGDIVILQCADRYRGGQSNARADVRQPQERIATVNGSRVVVTDTPKLSDLVGTIAREVNARWGGGFSARQRNDHELVVQCETGSQEVNFTYTIEGSRKQTVSIEELA
jgi:hypothetical protein